MLGFLQNLIILIVSTFLSIFGGLFGFFDYNDYEGNGDFPEISLLTQSAQGEGETVDLSDYPGARAENSEFLKALLSEYQIEFPSVDTGEHAEIQMNQEPAVYAMGLNDHPADVNLWEIDKNGNLSAAALNGVSVSIRYGILQLSFTTPEEDGKYLLTVYEEYNIGRAVHMIGFSIGETEETESGEMSYRPPETYDYDRAEELGYVVVTEKGVENIATLDRFIKNWEDGKGSLVYLIKEGKQGKPIVTQFISQKGKIIAFNDYTQIGGEIFEKEYKGIGVQAEVGGIQYYVVDSDGEGYLLFRMETDGDELRMCSGAVVAATERNEGASLLIYGTTNEESVRELYINILIDEQTDITRDGKPASFEEIKLGDNITAQIDTNYTSEIPNTVRAVTLKAQPFIKASA